MLESGPTTLPVHSAALIWESKQQCRCTFACNRLSCHLRWQEECDKVEYVTTFSIDGSACYSCLGSQNCLLLLPRKLELLFCNRIIMSSFRTMYDHLCLLQHRLSKYLVCYLQFSNFAKSLPPLFWIIYRNLGKWSCSSPIEKQPTKSYNQRRNDSIYCLWARWSVTIKYRLTGVIQFKMYLRSSYHAINYAILL